MAEKYTTPESFFVASRKCCHRQAKQLHHPFLAMTAAQERVVLRVSLRRVPIEVDGKQHMVLLKRSSRNAETFSLMKTNFSALIKGT